MVTETEEKTEQSTESSLEKAISSAQSETSSETETEIPADEAETIEPEAEDEKVKPDLEFEKLLKHPKVASHLQSEKDKAVNGYRQTRESDAEVIRSQAAKIKELSLKQNETKLTKAMEAVLAGDEENGVEPDKLEASRKGYEEIKASVLEYQKNAADVAEVAELATTLVKTLDKEDVDHFNLNDANHAVRARGIIDLVSTAISATNREKAIGVFFKEIPLLRNGSEVHKQMVSFVTEYLELPEGKPRDLLIEKLKREMSVSLKHKPTAPSGDSGGIDLSKLSGEELLRQAVEEDRRKGL